MKYDTSLDLDFNGKYSVKTVEYSSRVVEIFD